MSSNDNDFAFLNDVSTVAVVCLQFGDTGKGKIVDWLAEWAEVVVRGTGGANAGHTVCHDGKRYVLHLVPSGILRDGEGVENVIGSGTAVDPGALTAEIAALRAGGIRCANLRLSHQAHLVLPQHLVLDRVRESCAEAGKIGTTGRGMGPVYTDHYARLGLRVNDLLNPDEFVCKLRRNLVEKVRLLRTFDPGVVRAVMQHEHLASGAYYHPETIFDVDAIVARYLGFARELEPLVRDTGALVRRAHWDKMRIVLEGAQGSLLSVDEGTYPYVTSSDCSLHGLARGAGLEVATDVELALGLAKGFYMSRVGEGPFPTELGGERSAEWCGRPDVTEAREAAEYPAVSVNSSDAFEQGIAVRRTGVEYGSTTKRPRRVGWLDLPLLRYAVQRVPTRCELVLTKLDVLDDCERIKVCTHHEYHGSGYRQAEETLRPGMSIEVANPDSTVLAQSVPMYQTFVGWCSQLRNVESVHDLPAALVTLVGALEDWLDDDEVGADVRVLSVGPGREQTIVL
ncbi:MAG: adenylosuccinate synthetase [Candidatus Andersenbacteria bacterium]